MYQEDTSLGSQGRNIQGRERASKKFQASSWCDFCTIHTQVNLAAVEWETRQADFGEIHFFILPLLLDSDQHTFCFNRFLSSENLCTWHYEVLSPEINTCFQKILNTRRKRRWPFQVGLRGSIEVCSLTVMSLSCNFFFCIWWNCWCIFQVARIFYTLNSRMQFPWNLKKL